MATIKFRLHSKSKNSSIYLQLSLGRGRVYERKTGLSIDSNSWSKDTGYPKQTLAVHKALTEEIRELESSVYKALNEAEFNGESINGSWLGDAIDIYFGRKSKSGHSESVLYWIDRIVKHADIRKNSKGGLGLSKSRIQQYKQLRIKFEEFQRNKDYKVKEVNKALASEFLFFLLKDKGYKESYALKILENLKSVCYEAEEHVDVSPKLRKIVTTKPKSKFIVYLDEEELQKIADANIISPHLQNARKWLLLGCWIGQRGSDLLNVTPKNIKEKEGFRYFEIRQSKGDKVVRVPVLPKADEVLASGFPKRISIQNLNNYFKEVCRLAELNAPAKGSKKNPKTNRKEDGIYPKYELVGTHICRRSFCSNLYGELPTPVIMQASGHTTESVFLRYIGKSGLDYKDHWERLIIKTKTKAKGKADFQVIKRTS